MAIIVRSRMIDSDYRSIKNARSSTDIDANLFPSRGPRSALDSIAIKTCRLHVRKRRIPATTGSRKQSDVGVMIDDYLSMNARRRARARTIQAPAPAAQPDPTGCFPQYRRAIAPKSTPRSPVDTHAIRCVNARRIVRAA